MNRPPTDLGERRKIRKYVRTMQAEVNRLRIIPRDATKYPFDGIALATLSKVFALSNACLRLLDARLPDEAHGLSRSLVECATNLRHLTADPNLQDKRSR